MKFSSVVISSKSAAVCGVALFALGLGLPAQGAIASQEETTPEQSEPNQSEAEEPETEEAGSATDDDASESQSASDESAETETEANDDTENDVDEDNMADALNSSQQLEQSFILKRTIDGKVVETTTKTVTYTDRDPLRDTEAGQSVLEELRRDFDSALLTRREAFEEAKLDFALGDLDRDGKMTSTEFVGLVKTWRENDERAADATSPELRRKQRYVQFISGLNPDKSASSSEEKAMAKFGFMAGMSTSLSQKDYIREYLLDFDTMDEDNNALLEGDELMLFRAANRGENRITPIVNKQMDAPNSPDEMPEQE
ncbi:MAG: hypothetical protein AAFR21_09800 [Pseudomonadota bacterium]